MDNKKFKIIGITDITIRNILQNAGSDALALYIAYAEIERWQETYSVKATTGFMAKRMGWGDNKVIKNKKLLEDLGIISNKKDIDSETHRIKGWYIQIHHTVSEPDVDLPEGGFSHRVEKSKTSTTNNNISTPNNKEVLAPKVADLKENTDDTNNNETTNTETPTEQSNSNSLSVKKSEGANKDVVAILEAFRKIDPLGNARIFSNTTERNAAKEMLSTLNAQGWVAKIEKLASIYTMNVYFPANLVSMKPTEFLRNYGKIKIWVGKNINN